MELAGQTYADNPFDDPEVKKLQASGSISLPTEPETGDKSSQPLISFDQKDLPITYPSDVLEQRTGKYTFALGNQPRPEGASKYGFALDQMKLSPDDIKNLIQTGNEDHISAIGAQQELLKVQGVKNDLIKEFSAQAGPPTKEQIDLVQAMSADELQNPKTVLQRMYAANVVNMALATNPTLMPEGMTEKDHAAADLTTDLIARKEIAQKAIEDLDAQRNFVTDVNSTIKSFIPGVSWLALTNAISNADIGISEPAGTTFKLQGKTKQDLIEYLSLLPKEKFDVEFPRVIDEIAKYDNWWAQDVAKSFIEYSINGSKTDDLWNAIDLGSLVPGGALVKSAGKGIATAKSVVKGQTPVSTLLKGLVRANNGTLTNTVPNIVAATGNTPLTQLLLAGQSFSAKLAGVDKTEALKGIESLLPSLFSKQGWFSSAAAQASTGARKIIEEFEKARSLAGDIFSDTTLINRLDSPAEIQAAMQDAQDTMTRVYGADINSGTLDAVHIPAEGNFRNNDAVEFKIGRSDTSAPFDTVQEAYTWAHDHYQLPDKSYKIKSENGKFFISFVQDLPEVGDNIRNTRILTTGKPNPTFADAVLDNLAQADRLFTTGGNADRKIITYGNPRIAGLIREISQPLQKGRLTKAETQAVKETIANNQGVKGKWFNNEAELDAEYIASHGRTASLAEHHAYQTYKLLSDLDWMIRNNNKYVQMSRLGIQQARVSWVARTIDGASSRFKSDYFNGIVRDRLPNFDGNEFSVLYFNPDTKESKILYASGMDKAGKSVMDKLIKEGKLKVVQVHDSEKLPLKKLVGKADANKEINFVVTPNIQIKRLNSVQVGYSPGGGHLVYEAKAYTKQAKAWFNPLTKRHAYGGDTTVMPHGSMAEANAYAAKMERARELFVAATGRRPTGTMQAFEDFVRDNLPFTAKDLTRKFKNGTIATDQKFIAVPEGKSVADIVDLASGKQGLFDNMENSPYRTSRYTTGKFTGEKNAILPGVQDGSGNPGDPVFKLARPTIADPFRSLDKGLTEASHSMFYNDYRIKAVSDFADQFYDVFDKTKVSQDDLRRNPIYYFNNPEQYLQKLPRTDPKYPLYVRAKAQMNAINHLLGKNTLSQNAMNYLKSQALDFVYNKYGISKAAAFDEHFLSKVKDPVTYMRQAVFDMKIGLFHPASLFAQLSTVGNAMAISGAKDGFNGFRDAMLVNFLRSTENPNIIAHAAKLAGWKNPVHFTEMLKELRRAGFDRVGSEHGYIDNINDPIIFSNEVGSWLDKGRVFFREGERQARISGYTMAYQAWRRANPTKVLTNTDRGWIVNRADQMNLSMTRASNAAWQNGLFSLPTQFMAFPQRLMAQMFPLNKQLSIAEKARLWGYMSMMYGVPAAGIAAFPISNYAEDIRRAALDRGIDVHDNAVLDSLVNGMGETLTNAIFGTDFNWSQRFGPNSVQSISKAFSQDGQFNIVNLVAGAAGTSMMNIIKSVGNIGTIAFVTPFYDNSVHLKPADFLPILREISSGDKAVLAYYGMNYNKWIAKNGATLQDGDVTSEQILANLLFGVTTKDIQTYYSEAGGLRDAAQAKTETKIMIQSQLRQAALSMKEGTDSDYKQYYARAMALFEIGGFTAAEKMQIINEALIDNRDEIDKMNLRYVQKDKTGGRADLLPGGQ